VNKKSVFDRLDFRHNKASHHATSNSVVPKSNVFHRLQFDLRSSEKEMNTDHGIPPNNDSVADAMGHQLQNSNVAQSQGAPYQLRFYVRCLRQGH
jgi:hypothetical protein